MKQRLEAALFDSHFRENYYTFIISFLAINLIL